MTIEESLREIILSQYKTINNFATCVGIPRTTIFSIFNRGIMNTGVQTVIQIFDALDLDVESISTGTLRRKTTAPAKTADAAREKRLLSNFSVLNEDGQFVLLEVSDAMVESRRYVRRERRFAAADGHEAQPNDVSAEELDNLLGDEPTYDV